MYNRCVFVGRLGADPEMRYTPNGTPVAQMRIAVDRQYTNAQGQRETDWFDVVVWRKLAEQVVTHLTKGRLVLCEGEMRTRSFETQSGHRVKVTELHAHLVKFLDRAPEGQGQETPVADDDIPF